MANRREILERRDIMKSLFPSKFRTAGIADGYQILKNR